VVGSQGTGLTGVPTDLSGLARNSGRAKSISSNSKVTIKKPRFDELLHKYQRIASKSKTIGYESKGGISSSPKERSIDGH
jgi:hypothetical protein